MTEKHADGWQKKQYKDLPFSQQFVVLARSFHFQFETTD